MRSRISQVITMRLALSLAFVALATPTALVQNILPRTTYFMDSYGNPAGSATTNPVAGQTVFNDQYGAYEGVISKTEPNQYGA